MNDLTTQVLKLILAGLIILLATVGVALLADPPTPINPAQSSQPFIRELATGYLLQYSFLSPRPYCWTNDNTEMLSGWEVDKSAGHYEYHPTCRRHDGFAFHSDWFKLVDTSSNGAITLKHQVARQTEGALTLEFRFRLPAAMDGACWQLRDLEQAGVSLVTGAAICAGKPGQC